MGLVSAAIKLVAIPVTLMALIIIIIVFMSIKKKRTKDIEQTETFTKLQLPQAPPPTYGGPSAMFPKAGAPAA